MARAAHITLWRWHSRNAFGAPLPKEFNSGDFLTGVATAIDREYFARTWLIEQQAGASPTSRSRGNSLEIWNGKAQYVSFGEALAGPRNSVGMVWRQERCNVKDADMGRR